ncbi:hypothetical protein HYC85_007797 [Camellia sinensis]|uniref:non-specific serine/threonine protein kinase n=1 Tax=Camellia sinensis TaxID=4442 RepID=A0A7J7HRV0_CAMSI|nr:hypothetical protein HYC85_007797 [Camellia sinensis]
MEGKLLLKATITLAGCSLRKDGGANKVPPQLGRCKCCLCNLVTLVFSSPQQLQMAAETDNIRNGGAEVGLLSVVSVKSRSTGVERVQFGSDPDRIPGTYWIACLCDSLYCDESQERCGLVCVRARANLVNCEEEQQHQQLKDEPLKNLPGNGTAISPSKTNSTVPKMPNTAESQEIQGAGVISVTPKNVRDLHQNRGYISVDIFTYEEMRMATKHFRPDQVLGEGGFGIVYKGVINENVRPGYKTTLVAIKELDREGFQGDREWLAEVNYLSQLRHTNLVKLIGYCCEDDHRLLVYEYMASGSLEKHLFRRVCATLTWTRRMKIALDAAKGLSFLHGAERSIIYRDFKTSNILLDAVAKRGFRIHLVKWEVVALPRNKRGLAIGDIVARNIALLSKCLWRFPIESESLWHSIVKSKYGVQANGKDFILDFNAKLSDFGLAKDGPLGDQTHVSTRVMGTYGYAAPEYVMTGHLTARSDVYGFGVVLLEMLIGRKAMDKSRPSREHNLVEWARPLLNHNKKLLRILDPRMEGQYSNRTALKVANLAYQCLSQNPKGRPVMSQVVEILETVQTQDQGSREEAMLQSGGGSITLYEVPKGTPHPSTENKISQVRSESEREADGVPRRNKPANGRSKSEPPKECDLYGTSPDLGLDEESEPRNRI